MYEKIRLVDAVQYQMELINQMPEDNPYRYLELMLLCEVENFDSHVPFVAQSEGCIKVDLIFEKFLNEFNPKDKEPLKYERTWVHGYRDIRIDRFLTSNASYLVMISLLRSTVLIFTSNLKDWFVDLHKEYL